MAMSGFSALKVNRCWPFLILNLVTRLFFLMKTAAYHYQVLFFAFEPLAALAPFGPLARLRNSLKSLIYFGYVMPSVPFGLALESGLWLIIKN